MPLQLNDAQELEHIWRNGGLKPDGDPNKRDDYVTLNDALSTPNAPNLFPKVIENTVREAIEPLTVGTSLLTRINYKYGQQISFGATGALVAGPIPESGEYPEQYLDTAQGTVQATIGKYGVAVKVTDEMVRYSLFDVIGMNLRAAGKALARLKEQNIFNMFRNQGVTSFDNLNPTNSVHGSTTGRAIDGSANGSVTMDDMFDAWAQVLAQGFMVDTLVMHPLTWSMFVKDPHMRMFALNSGGGTFFANWTGNPQGGFPQWEGRNLGPSHGQNVVPGGNQAGLDPTGSGEQSQTQTGAPELPEHAGFMTGLRIVVTPYVPFDAKKKLTDIYMLESGQAGFHVVDEEPTTEEFDDPARDIRKIKIRERYALAMANESHAVTTLKNVKVVPNEIVLPGQVHIDSSATINPIDQSTSPL